MAALLLTSIQALCHACGARCTRHLLLAAGAYIAHADPWQVQSLSARLSALITPCMSSLVRLMEGDSSSKPKFPFYANAKANIC